MTSTATQELTLGDYLALTMQIDEDLSRASGNLSTDLSGHEGDPEKYIEAVAEFERAISVLVATAIEKLSGITPPLEAEQFHKDLLASLNDLQDFAGEMAEVLGEGNFSDVSSVLISATDVIGQAAELSIQAQPLLVRALRDDGEDDLDAYLIEVLATRSELSTELVGYSESLQPLLSSGDTEELVSLLGDLIASLEAFEQRFKRLSPPSEAEEIHERQIDLVSRTIEAEHKLLTALEEEDVEAITSATLELAQEIPAEGSYLSAAWSAMTILALRR